MRQPTNIITIQTPELTLAFARDDGGLCVLERHGGVNVLGHGAPTASVDIQIADDSWLAERVFVRYLGHTYHELHEYQELELVIGLGPLKLYDRYRITGTLITRTLAIQNVGDDPIRINAARLTLPWVRIGERESCQFEAPGTSIRPHVPLATAADQRPGVLPRRFFAPGLRDDRAFEAAPLFSAGLMTIHNPELEEGLLCWYDSQSERAFPELNGNGGAVCLRHEVAVGCWLAGNGMVEVGRQYVLLVHEPWPAALAAFRRTWATLGAWAAPIPAPHWLADAAIYETHPGLFGGFNGLKVALDDLATLGINTLCLLPIWPYGAGRAHLWDGSWQTASDVFALRELEQLDPTLGSIEQLRDLVAAAHACGMRVLLDLPLLGCSPDSAYIYEHPEWFSYDRSGRLVSVPGRNGIMAFDWSAPTLRAHIAELLLTLLHAVGFDGFRAISPRVAHPNWGQSPPPHFAAGQMAHLLLLADLRERLRDMPDAVLIGDLAGPLSSSFEAATIAELAHHMFVHTALNRMTPAELGVWLADNQSARAHPVAQICFTESHRTHLINPLADGMRGSRISRMLLAGIVLCGFIPSIWSGQERDESMAIQRVLSIRQEHATIRHGSVAYDAIPCNSPQMFTVLRRYQQAHAIGLLHIGPNRQSIMISLPIDLLDLADGDYMLLDVISGRRWVEHEQDVWQRDQLLSLSLTLEPYTAYCFLAQLVAEPILQPI